MRHNQASPARPKRRKAATHKPIASSPSPASFPIVGIGASAGGLEAFTELFTHLPGDVGMAYVLISHLAPSHESALTALVAKKTPMPVSEATDGTVVQKDHVYVIPPNVALTISKRTLRLVRRKESGPHMPVDAFLRSLAQEHGENAIGVVLSGNGSDGVLGLRAVKAAGGITIAQDEKTAAYNGMPSSAVAAGCVDLVLSPSLIAKELLRFARHPRSFDLEESVGQNSAAVWNGIYSTLRANTQVDFSDYKSTTLQRRINRRMALRKQTSLAGYADYLKANPAEVEDLFDELLIHVTGFFREPDSFEALKKKIYPLLLKSRPADTPIRVWTTGCATGEEAYSLAISLVEFLEDRQPQWPVQVFATDISESSLAKARAGIYPESIESEVSARRLRRFFHKQDGTYQVNKTVRDLCVFARQNVVMDPPFSNLDLICCRNLLIYMGRPLQTKVMPLFHYALRPTGFLMLGNSETTGVFSHLFKPVDQRHKIYARKSAHRPAGFGLQPFAQQPQKAASTPPLDKPAGDEGSLDLIKQSERIILSQYAPCGVVINADMEVMHFHGHTGAYLEHAGGQANLNLLTMARGGLVFDLRMLVAKAMKLNARVRSEGVRVGHNDHDQAANIEVIPLRPFGSKDRHFLVLFSEAAREHLGKEKQGRSPKTGKRKNALARLHSELEATRASLQVTIDEKQAFIEELRSANEEILSSNEEMQSTNEELETAKEEVQSTNEELTTLNDELESRNVDLDQLNNDLANLLGSVQIPIVMLGMELNIRRFTRAAEKSLNLIPGDVGRPITDLQLGLNVPDLASMIREVIDTLTVKQCDVQDREGRWYSLWIRPYKTGDHKIGGAVMALIDIHEMKQARVVFEAVVDTVREPLLVLDNDLRVTLANRSFHRFFRVKPEETVGRHIFELGNGQWRIPDLEKLLEGILPQNSMFDDFLVEHVFPHIGRKRMLLNARRLEKGKDHTEMLLLAMEDVTEKPKKKGAVSKTAD